jgi:hypothetical protein
VSVDPDLIAPWAGAVEDLVRGALRHVYSVRIWQDTAQAPTYLPVKVTACEVSFDEFWSPYVQGSLTAVLPDDATLAKLDPRLLVVVEVSAGYVLPGGVSDSHLMCKALLSRRTVNYPANEVVLEFQGLEYAFDRAEAEEDGGGPQGLSPGGYWDTNTTAAAAIGHVYQACGFSAVSFAALRVEEGIGGLSGWVDPGQQWTGKAGDNYLDIARDIADRVEGWLRVDEFGTLLFTGRTVGGKPASHRLRVGADGTVITVADTLSRDDWANFAYVRYEWTTKTTSGGVTTEVQKTASAWASATGAYDPVNVGKVGVSEIRQMMGSQVQASFAAPALLKRYLIRATSLSVQAIAAYWLRPDDGVSVALPTGPEVAYRVSAVSFNLDDGSMAIRTRTPDPGPTRPKPDPIPVTGL